MTLQILRILLLSKFVFYFSMLLLGYPRSWTFTQAQIPQIGAEHPDIITILDIQTPAEIGIPSNAWTDSYSYQGRCYCWTNFDHDIGDMEIDTGLTDIGTNGILTVQEACELIGQGPGPWGNPIYNDVQVSSDKRLSIAHATDLIHGLLSSLF